MLMNVDDAARHDTYISNYIRTNNAKVIGSTRLVLAKVCERRFGRMFLPDFFFFLFFKDCRRKFVAC